MNVELLQKQIVRAQADSQFFEALASNPQVVIPNYQQIEQKVKTALVNGSDEVSAPGLHRYGAYEACTRTSCGCGGSI